jgi:hypothetical protein
MYFCPWFRVDLCYDTSFYWLRNASCLHDNARVLPVTNIFLIKLLSISNIFVFLPKIKKRYGRIIHQT